MSEDLKRLEIAWLAVAVLLGPANPLHAQDPPPPPILDLGSWTDGVWLSLLDRDGGWNGRLAEEGIFQRFHPRMDDEYALDLRSGLFGPDEDARWADADRGFRAAGASISHPYILNLVQWRDRIPIAGAVDLVARYDRGRSLSTRRDYLRVGAAWRDPFGSGLDVWSTLAIHFFKPSADVEVGVVRSWGSHPVEPWRVDLRVAALDAFSDLIFEGLGVDDEEVDAHLNYKDTPWAARVGIRGMIDDARVELHLGGSPRSEVRVTFPGTGEAPYRQLEQVAFVGGRVQFRVTPHIDVALFATLARADVERVSIPAGDFGFTLREQTERLGARGEMHLRGPWTAAADVELLWRPEDRTTNDGERVRHRDREAFGRLALLRRPVRGWTARLTYEALDRNAGVIVPVLSTVDHRLNTESGYRFASGFEIVGGVRWDLDYLTQRIFDGGQLRMSMRW